jgi:hypothetical protein
MTYTKPTQIRLEKYKISDEQFTALWYVQSGACRICRAALVVAGTGGSAIDHCHTSGKVRGLLCYRCNVVLGNIEAVGIGKFIDYLTRGVRIGAVQTVKRERTYSKTNLGRPMTSAERKKRCLALKAGRPDPFAP